MPFRPFLSRLFLLVPWLFAGAATAAVHRDLSYVVGADPLQALDVYVPERPGPHPVVVFLHGGRWHGGDKGDARATAAAFLAQEYVFVSVNYRLVPAATHPAQVQDSAAALAWVARRIAEFGGDPGRIHLMGQGAGAQLAALLATDARRLAKHGLDPALLRGVMLFDAIAYDLAQPLGAGEDALAIKAAFGDQADGLRDASPTSHLSPPRHLPPALLFFSGDNDAVRLQTEALADRWRGAGASAQLQTTYEGGTAAGGHSFGAPGDATTAQAFAWLRSLQVPRVQRFENLVFARDVALPEAGEVDGTGKPAMVAHEGALYAAVPRVTSSDGTRGGQVLRRDAKASSWAADAAFEQDLVGLRATGLASDHGGAGPRRVLLAFLAGTRGEVQVSSRAGSGAAWSPPASLALRVSQGGTVVGAEHRDAKTGLAGYFVASTTGPALLQRLELAAGATALRASESEALDAAGPVLALAVANGVLHAAIGRAGNDRGGLYRRVDGAQPRWELALASSASGPALAMAAVPDPQGSGREVLLLATERGTMERVDPGAGYGVALELDFLAAFRGMWRGLGPVQAGAAGEIVPLRHPQSNDLVHVLGLAMAHPAPAVPGHGGGYYLVRQLDASYSYGLARDFREGPPASAAPATIRGIVGSPYTTEESGAWYFTTDTGGGPTGIFRAHLDRAMPAQGLWWDRAHPGHGLSLHPVGDRWLATLYTFDESGEPVWYLAVGQLRDGRFIADSSGLARYRLRPGERVPQQQDLARSGSIALDFDVAAPGAACRDGVDRKDAVSLAALRVTLEGRSVDWCVEPIRYGVPGLPAVDTSGVWFDGSAESGWGLMLAPRGPEGSTREAGIVSFYDGRGEPRWVLGLGELARGAASLELRSYSGPCPGCDARILESRPAGTLSHGMRGYCGETAGNASMALDYPGAAGGRLVVDNVPLQPLTTQHCY